MYICFHVYERNRNPGPGPDCQEPFRGKEDSRVRPPMAEEVHPYADIRIGAMPADNGIGVEISTGSPNTTFMTKGMQYEFQMVLNGKNSDQELVFDTLNDIHQLLTQETVYPSTTDYQIMYIKTTATPNYIGRQENKQYLYGSALSVRFFYKKPQII